MKPIVVVDCAFAATCMTSFSCGVLHDTSPDCGTSLNEIGRKERKNEER